MSKWIEFHDQGVPQKTKRFTVLAKDGGVILGTVKWFGRWRKYAFFPHYDTVFETQCLGDIIEFINKLMEERKDDKSKAKANTVDSVAG